MTSTASTPSPAACADRLAARELIYRYCFAVDMGTLDDVMSLFADRCELLVDPGGLFTGRAAVTDWYRSLIRGRMAVLRHLTSNQVLELDGDHARSKSYWDAVGDLNGEAMVAAGFYEDELARIGGTWKYTRKIIRIDYMAPLREGWGGPRRIKCRLVRGLDADVAGWR